MVTGILLYLAFIRLLHSDYHIEGGAMLVTAGIAVCANLLYGPVWSSHLWGSGQGALLQVGRAGPPLPDRQATQNTASQQAALGMPEPQLGEAENSESTDTR